MSKSRKLILSVTKKDIDISYFSGTGAGGQHRNRHMNSCRMHHRASGAQATGQDSRSKKENTKNCFLRLINSPKFLAWQKMEVAKRMVDENEIERAVTKSLRQSNLKYEVRNENGDWVEVDPELIGENDE